MTERRRATISIIVPCYNDGRFLSRSIGSVIHQLDSDDEIIVVDDASTDATASIVSEIRRESAQVQLLQHETNAGVAQARNSGLAAARGDYVIFLDADDELVHGALRHYRQAIATHEPAWLIGGHVWDTRAKRRTRVPRISHAPQANFRRFIGKKLHLGNLSCMCFAKTHTCHGFPIHLRVGEDHVFLALLLATSVPYVVEACCAEVHRRASDSLRSASNKDDLVTSRVNATLFAHPDLPQHLQKYRRSAEKRHYVSILRFAWKKHDAALFRAAYSEAMSCYPSLVWHPKLTWRRLMLRSRIRA